MYRGVFKRLAYALLGVLGGLVSLLFVLSFWIDVDRLKSEALAKVNQYLNGELQLESVHLALWGEIAFEVRNLSLVDSQKQTVLKVDKTKIKIPLSGLVDGLPIITVEFNAPALNILRSQDGQLNLSTLIHTQNVESPEEAKNKRVEAAAIAEQEGSTIDRWIKSRIDQASVDLIFTESKISFSDLASGDQQVISGLNLKVIDLSLIKPMRIEADWLLAAKVGKTLSLQGPLQFIARVKTEFKDRAFSGAVVDYEWQAKELKAEVKGLLSKNPGDPFKLNGTIQYGADALEILEHRLQFKNSLATGKLEFRGQIRQLSKDPLLKLQSSLKLDSLSLKGVGSSPAEAIKPNEAKASESSAQAPVGLAPTPQPTSPEDIDGLLKPLRERKLLMGAVIKLDTAISSVVLDNIELKDLRSQIEWNKGVSELKNLELKLLSGELKAEAKGDIRPSLPTLTGRLSLKGLRLEQGLIGPLAPFQNSFKGSLSFQSELKLKGLDQLNLLKNLESKAEFEIKEPVLRTVDAQDLMLKGLEESLAGVKSLVPKYEEYKKSFSEKLRKKGRLKLISGELLVAEGQAQLKSFKALAEPKEGVDLYAQGKVNLLTEGLEIQGEIVDTYGISGAQAVSLEVDGHKVPEILQKKGEPFKLPIKIGCKLTKPCFDYSELPKAIGAIAAQKIKAKAHDIVRDKFKGVRKEAEESARKELENKGKKALEKFKAKLPF